MSSILYSALRHVLPLLILVSSWLPESSMAEAVKIGVLSFRPKPQTLSQWQPLSDALKRAIPSHDFIVEAFDYEELTQAVASRQVDFVLTNSAHYVLLAHRNGLSAPLATLAIDDAGKSITVFGGVIFCRADDLRIKDLKDIEHKTIALTGFDSFGGYHTQLHELNRLGIHPQRDARLLVTGMPHDKVVDAVLTGKADVGFVRSGLLESLDKEGKVPLQRFKVLNPQKLHDFPYQVSTQLYPEWPLVAMPQTDETLARHVAATLFLLDETPMMTHAMGIHGFVVPADYSPVMDVLRELRQPPFDTLPVFTLQDVWTRYRWPIIVALAVALLILILGLRLLITKRILKTQHQTLLEQTRQLQLAASVFTHAREGILITDSQGDIIDVNHTFSKITGYSRDEVLGKNPRFLGSGWQSREFYAELWRELIEQGSWSGEIWNRRKNGEVFAEMLTIGAVRDDQGQTKHYVALFSDITANKEHQRQLEHIAHYDALTGLPNRVLLADRLHQAMAQALRSGRALSVAYLDLDGFKSVNDHYGHDIGDKLLMVVATRMRDTLREGDTLARIGGDEFVAVLLDIEDVGISSAMLQRLLAVASEAVCVDDLTLYVSASIGVTFYPQRDTLEAEQLLRQADQAMYQAKLTGKNRYHVFDPELDSCIRVSHETQDRIRQALIDQEFLLYYQPKVDMQRGVLIGVEALIRWRHPQRGLVAPAEFLPIIEDHPLAIEIGDWVIATALAQSEQWRRQGLTLPVSVNVCARQLQHPQFVEKLQTALAAHTELGPDCLELEVLETSALGDLAGVIEVIGASLELGVSFALDDFGTGYSSLTYLKRLPVNVLKIDQSFVRGMLDDPDDLAILQGVLGLAQAFKREVIAEGVETVEHGIMLLQLGCRHAQGYCIAKPMPGDALVAWWNHWQPPASWRQAVEVDAVDHPLIFTAVEHHAWLLAMEKCLDGERSTVPALSDYLRHLGLWLSTEGHRRFKHSRVILELDASYQHMCHIARELVACHAGGQSDTARARLDQLFGLQDDLKCRIQTLMARQQTLDSALFQRPIHE